MLRLLYRCFLFGFNKVSNILAKPSHAKRNDDSVDNIGRRLNPAQCEDLRERPQQKQSHKDKARAFYNPWQWRNMRNKIINYIQWINSPALVSFIIPDSNNSWAGGINV